MIEAVVMLAIGLSMAGMVLGNLNNDQSVLVQKRLLLWMMTLLAFMLGQLEISNLTAAFLVLVAVVFVGSFAVVSLQTGELIKPPKND